MDVVAAKKRGSFLRGLTPRFSLRTFCVAVLMLGAGFGWLGNEIIPIRQRLHLLARIKATGGKIAYQHEGKSGLYSGPPRSRHWLRSIFGDEAMAEIEHVQWYQPLPYAADISLLDELPHLKSLVLNGPNISDAVAKKLRKIPKLREV